MKKARDVTSAYRDVGSYRGAAVICGTTHKTVKRIIEAHNAGGIGVEKAPQVRNYDAVADLVAKRVKDTSGRVSAKTCRRPGRPAMKGRRGTSDAWSRTRRRPGARAITVADGPRSGRPGRR